MRRILGVSLILLGILATPATADRDRGTDGQDSPSQLDITSMAHGHGGGQLVHRLRTYEPWKRKSLRGDNRWIVMWISTNDRPSDPEGFERHIWIDYKRGRLRAVMLRPVGGMQWAQDKRVANVSVRKIDARTVVVRFPKRLLGRDIVKYRWWAQTSWESRRGACKPDGSSVADNPHPFGLDGSCFDRAPRHHYLRHRL